MCGIAFLADTNIVDTEVSLFKDLMVLTSLRGTDAAGVACNYATDPGADAKTYKPIVRYSKMTGNVYNLLESKWWGTAVRNIAGPRRRTVLLGHCRAATRGEKISTNAHPFSVGKLCGVHNGTITSGLKIPDGETDSEAIYELIEKEGIDALKDITGAYALAWINEEEQRFYWIRNDQRPLFFGWKGNTIIGASEKAFLDLLNTRGATITDITEVKPYHLYSVPITHQFLMKAERLSVEDKTEVLKPKTFATRIGAWRSTNYGNFQDYDWEGYGVGFSSSWRKAFEERTQGTKESRTSTSTFRYLRGLGQSVSPTELKDALAEGCCSCGGVSGDTDFTYWRKNDTGEYQYVCEECAQVETINNGEDGLEATFPGIMNSYRRFSINKEAMLDNFGGNL